MFNLQDSMFQQQGPKIPEDTQAIVVADMFVEDYVGGAELTTQALIDSSPFTVAKLHSKDVTMELLQKYSDKFWIFGNFTGLNFQLIPSIVANLKYVILEYDYKYCRFRSPEKHLEKEGRPCDCHDQISGKMVSAFYYGSMGLWWMSEAQKDHYTKLFPFLAERDNVVLSSVFSDITLGALKLLRGGVKDEERKGWIVLGSKSWIKGAEDAVQWCKDNDKEYSIVWDMPYDQVLARLAAAEGLVYLPRGMDTCPRMVIEAKLLGCELHINDNVQHKDEEWFATDDIQAIEEYLFTAPKMFWNGVKAMMDYVPSISGYITTLNCVKQSYPFVGAIKSMLEFCDEVCIVDGGSDDGTLMHLAAMAYPFAPGVVPIDFEVLSTLWAERASDDGTYEFPDEYQGIKKDPRIRVKVIPRDWDHPRFAVFDGKQKAEARAMCTKDFCWQMDSDEVVHEEDGERIFTMARHMPREPKIVALPVIEYWGGPEKVRVDVLPWKWRLSRNDPDITHGIPKELRLTDDDGHTYAKEGTDGCDMISKKTGERLPFINFYTQDVDNARRMALLGDTNALQQYEAWFNRITEGMPGVFHYSWYDLPRKIRLYRDYWTRHWCDLRNDVYSDSAEQNMMFDVPWSEVTEEMIEARAKEFKDKLGGWIWHKKWDGKTTTPHITCARQQPEIMRK